MTNVLELPGQGYVDAGISDQPLLLHDELPGVNPQCHREDLEITQAP